jgi:hypothetical protein
MVSVSTVLDDTRGEFVIVAKETGIGMGARDLARQPYMADGC